LIHFYKRLARMSLGYLVPVACCLLMLQVRCGPTLEHEKEHDRPLHGKPLSHKEHHDDIDHDYDHEAFLGEEQAAEFDDLSPEESQRRLGIIVDRIDTDGNGHVSVEELAQWIKFTQTRYVTDDVERQWASHKPEGKETIGWEEYRHNVYGFLDEDHTEEEQEQGFSYKQMETRDGRRWLLADRDHSGELDLQEFAAFLHPEEAEHMKDIVVQETLEDIDKDGDGKVSMEEYIGDMYKDEDGEDGGEPDWVASEREQFTDHRDTDKDGFMNLEEVRAWIIPADFDHSGAEAKHLVFESDEDQDGSLTKEEILEKYDLFVGSQATDFGEALSRHDEF